MQDVEIIGMLKTYISATLSGMGALKGASCQIQSIEAITGGNRITFAWEDNDGVSTTSVLDVMDGSDGDTGVGISGVAIDDNDHLVVTYTDGTTEDAGALPTVSVGVSDLTDVSLTDLADGELLKYNSTTGKWVNASGSSVDTSLVDLSDVSVTSVADGQFIKWDATTSRWVNATLADIATSGSWNDLIDTPTTLSGYGITDAYTKDEIDTSLEGKADAATTLSGYGITDAYTKTETDTLLSAKADSATTLSGYGITDAYTKTETDTLLSAKADNSTTLSGYGITDAYTQTEVDTLLADKADSATTLSGYGITDAYTKTEVDTALADKADSATTLSGYGITDAYTKTETDTLLDGKADSATTLSGYGITDAYTKTETDTLLADKADSATTLSGYGITDAYTKTETDSAITSAIEALDVTDTAIDGSYITAVSETDGKISVTREAADTTPTEDSTAMITSGGAYTALEDKVDWSDYTQTGAVNIIPNNITDQTSGSVTISKNTDGTITINGTNSNVVQINLISNTYATLSDQEQYTIADYFDTSKTYTLKGSGSDNCGMRFAFYDTDGTRIDYITATSSDVTIDFSSYSTAVYFAAMIYVKATTHTDEVIYPMICPSAYSGDYVPYAETNYQLTHSKVDWESNGILGVKNVLPFDLDIIKSENTGGTWVDNAFTFRDVTYTINSDGSIGVSGTASPSSSIITLTRYNIWLPSAGRYKLVCEDITDTTTDWIYLYNITTSSDIANSSAPYFTYNGTDSLVFKYMVKNEKSVNKTIHPMIVLADDTDSTFRSYAKTNQDLTQVAYDNAGAHNSVYRGKYLGDSVSDEQYAAISNGTFKNLYIGDYWTINDTTYRIASFDYWYNAGDTACSTHHVVLVPDSNMYTAAMNSSETASGGYVGSEMYTTNLADALTTITTDFTSDHLLNHRELLTNTVTDGASSAWAWYDSTVELMNEVMVYGHNTWGSHSGYETGIDKTQLPLFALKPELITNRSPWWERNVASATYFAAVGNRGSADRGSSSYEYGVRPCFGIIG